VRPYVLEVRRKRENTGLKVNHQEKVDFREEKRTEGCPGRGMSKMEGSRRARTLGSFGALLENSSFLYAREKTALSSIPHLNRRHQHSAPVKTPVSLAPLTAPLSPRMLWPGPFNIISDPQCPPP
jgi:hypothetical protein